MRKFITIISALLLVLILSQCKKKPVVTDNGPEPISITLNVAGGSKVLVTPSTGEVAFENGDVIYVAYKGKYVGTIIHNGSCFTGEISATPDNETPLYFYFLGNKTPYETLTKGSSTSISVDIIDQTDSTKLPVISAAASKEPFIGEGTYTSTLENKCALVKFIVTTPSESPIYITGMHNKMQVTFAPGSVGSFTPIKSGSGAIKLEAGGGTNIEKWAILLEQPELPAGGAETAYSSDWNYTGTRGAVPQIGINGYITSGVNVVVDNTEHQGQLLGVFSVSSENKVKFSSGNLRYHTSTKKFSFNEGEHSVIHYLNADVTDEYAEGSNCYIDMFGWGTSGNDHGAVCYQPWSTSDINSNYYAYGISTLNLNDNIPPEADWGYNPITNGIYGKWRTLTNAEWGYLLNDRGDYTTTYRFCFAKLAGMPGIILFPDDWDISLYSVKFVNQVVNFKKNEISINVWNDIFAPNGAVFLPAAGYRKIDKTGETAVSQIGGAQSEGHYWSADVVNGNVENAYCLTFTSSILNYNYSVIRSGGRSVRLVCDVAAE